MTRFKTVFCLLLLAGAALATAADAGGIADARIGGPGYYSFEGAPGYPACNPYNRYYNPYICGGYNPGYDGYYPAGTFADGAFIGAGGTHGRGVRGGFYRSGRLSGRYW